MTTPPRPCLNCGTLTFRRPAYCDRHEADRQHTRNTQRTHLQGDWPALSRQLRQQWLDTHGPWCPGWGIPPHPCHPAELTVDHVTARSRAELTVCCRSCNSRKGATHDKQPAG